jgi:hypothetical protein
MWVFDGPYGTLAAMHPCGVFFERTLMHSDPHHRSEFGKPALVCTDCKSYWDDARVGMW